MPPRLAVLTSALAHLILPINLAVASTEPPDALLPAWLDTSRHLFVEAAPGFAQTDSPEARLGRAALLLVKQPKTERNVADAEASLADLAGGSAPPAVAASARYLLARSAHLHRVRPDLALATSHYRRLLAEHPGHFLADQALVKLALIEMHEPGITDTERVRRADYYATAAEALARPGPRRDLHLLLAETARQYALGEERQLRHNLGAEAAGVARPTQRANVLVAIGELASRTGRPEMARTHFEQFLAEFSRDYRRSLVRDKLAALPAPNAEKKGTK